MEYEFTLKFALPANHQPVHELLERLGEAGCEDALVGAGQPGRIALDFTRDADSAKNAIFSALDAVRSAIPGAKLLEVTPDFVGLSDIFDCAGGLSLPEAIADLKREARASGLTDQQIDAELKAWRKERKSNPSKNS
jgi:hypothetical protein